MPSDNDNYLAGKILISMPQMGDPRFHRAVVFMCAHDANGAMGLVINHLLPGFDFSELLTQLQVVSEKMAEHPVLFPPQPVFSGGPVESARGFILHGSDFSLADTIKINRDIYVTGTLDALKAIAAGAGPQKMRFVLGYAGWGPGQLEREIRENAWLVTDPDPETVLAGDPENMWERAIRTLGIDPLVFSGAAGRA